MSLSNRFSYPDQLHENSITARTPHNALLLISSKDRFRIDPKQNNSYSLDSESGTYNNFFINQEKLNGFGQIKRVGVSEVSFPWTTPNVNERNNLFLFADGSGNGLCYGIQIQEGFYDASTLSLEIQFQLNNNIFLYPSFTTASTYGQPNWQAIYEPINNTITIKNDPPPLDPPIYFLPSSAPLGTPTPQNYLGSLFSLPVATFESINDGQQPQVSAVKGGYAMMEYTRYIDVCSDTLCKFQALKDSLTQQTYTNIICRLYLNSQSINLPSADNTISQKGDAQFFVKFTNIKMMDWNPDNMIGGFDIKYLDDAGQPLYIPPQNTLIPQYFTLLLSES
jgi:hypothetical protein